MRRECAGRNQTARADGSIALLVEVAASTTSFDLNEKARIYAAAGIPEYWVADVNKRVIHQMWSPDGEAYAERRDTRFGSPVGAATVSALTVDTAQV